MEKKTMLEMLASILAPLGSLTWIGKICLWCWNKDRLLQTWMETLVSRIQVSGGNKLEKVETIPEGLLRRGVEIWLTVVPFKFDCCKSH